MPVTGDPDPATPVTRVIPVSQATLAAPVIPVTRAIPATRRAAAMGTVTVTASGASVRLHGRENRHTRGSWAKDLRTLASSYSVKSSAGAPGGAFVRVRTRLTK